MRETYIPPYDREAFRLTNPCPRCIGGILDNNRTCFNCGHQVIDYVPEEKAPKSEALNKGGRPRKDDNKPWPAPPNSTTWKKGTTPQGAKPFAKKGK